MKNIYEYLNYRVFLRDYYILRKESGERFSHRVFASDAEFSSPNFLKNVIDGIKDLGPTSIPKVAKACRLKKKEAQYFTLLVAFNKAKKDEKRNILFNKLTKIRSKKKIEPLTGKQLEFYNKWYYPVVRELVSGKTINCNPADIAKLILPEITATSVINAIKTLIDLKLIYIKNNKYYSSSNLIKMDIGAASLAIRNFQSTMLKYANNALRELPPEDRHISSVTLKIKKEKYDDITERIDNFRAELLEMATEDSNPDTVFQINLQLFPLSKRDMT